MTCLRSFLLLLAVPFAALVAPGCQDEGGGDAKDGGPSESAPADSGSAGAGGTGSAGTGAGSGSSGTDAGEGSGGEGGTAGSDTADAGPNGTDAGAGEGDAATDSGSTGTDASATPDGGAGDAAANAPDADTGMEGDCNRIANVAPSVELQIAADSEAAPEPMGGAVTGGTYVATAFTRYTFPWACDSTEPAPDEPMRLTLRFEAASESAGRLEMAGASRANHDYWILEADTTKLAFRSLCPEEETGELSFTILYTASPDEILLFDNYGSAAAGDKHCGTDVTTLTRLEGSP